MVVLLAAAIVVGLVAIVWVALVHRSLKRIKETVYPLEQMHAIASARREGELEIEFKGLLLARREEDVEEAVRGDLAAEAVFERLAILGYDRGEVMFDKPNGGQQAFETVEMEVPEGTSDVILIPTQHALSFGKMLEFTDTTFSIRLADHHHGFAYVSVSFLGIVRSRANIEVGLLLRDINGDDPWAGWVVFTALFLGPA